MKPENYIQKMMMTPLAKVEEIAAKEFQLMRRLECSDANGYTRCITCGVYRYYKNIDAGHFIQRYHKGTKFEPNNVWPQCYRCNCELSGNHAVYRDVLVKKLGRHAVEIMEENKDKTPPLWKEKVIEVILKSRERIKEIKKTNGI